MGAAGCDRGNFPAPDIGVPSMRVNSPGSDADKGELAAGLLNAGCDCGGDVGASGLRIMRVNSPSPLGGGAGAVLGAGAPGL